LACPATRDKEEVVMFETFASAAARGLLELVHRYDGDPANRADTPSLLRLLTEQDSRVSVHVDEVEFMLLRLSVVVKKGLPVEPPAPGLKFEGAVIEVAPPPRRGGRTKPLGCFKAARVSFARRTCSMLPRLH
jgi:hypothetical protein